MFGETLAHSFYVGVGISVPACVMGQHLFSGWVNLPLQVTTPCLLRIQFEISPS